MADLVTGEAVALDIRVARLPSRAIALLLDLMIQYIVLTTATQIAAMTALVVDEAIAVGLTIVGVALVVVGYPAIMETLTRGRTLGKIALGLRVVSDDGGPERFRQALFRALAGVPEFWMLLGSPALIASLFNRQGKRLGDIFAGTIVIQERVAASSIYGPVAMMPPQLAAWAASLEMSRLPDGLAMTARQYLARFWELMPQVRDMMGQRLVEQIMTRVSPPPPAGMRPEIYLSAVLAERRRRDERRLAQRRSRRQTVAQRASLPGQPVRPGSSAQPGYPGSPAQTGYPVQADSPAQLGYPGGTGYPGRPGPPPGGPARPT